MKLWGFVDGELKDLKAEIELLKRYRDEAESDAAVARLLVDKLRLTDEERKAIEWAILTLANSSSARVGVAMDNVIAAQQLRKLLERLG